MGDKDKLDITDTFVPYDDHTSQTKLLKALGESLGQEGTTVQHRYQPKAARVSWTQRVLSWFRND